MDIRLVIPARYRSTRLPGKPLIDIAGTPLLERTWRRCTLAFPQEKIYVATDDQRIADYCESKGIQWILTSPDCLTGTDRIAEFAEKMPADYYINVQGDEPLINPEDIKRIVAAAQQSPTDLHLGICEVTSEEQYRNPSIPKAVFRQDKRLLYVSRASIPAPKSLEYRRAWRPVWIYGFSPAALKAYAGNGGKTTIEAIEDNEIIRFLELGYEVHLVEMSSESIAVDTPEDVAEVERALVQRGMK
ncbi:MAG TPA: 3-deoxy-manno-octulosonate cytidylyltransferase [Devosiaceae bacterium]|jgi:3-deoxy-manno-octulosonate cytidylyltransferase (CMP-KDO synthetase)